jgi:hypothetical protein
LFRDEADFCFPRAGDVDVLSSTTIMFINTLDIGLKTEKGEKKMALPKLSSGLIIALAATSVFLTLVTAGIIATQTVASNGTVSSVNVGVYSNSQCNQNCTSITWGTIDPGDSTSKTVYVKNTGTIPITLSMATESWTPTNADDYLTLTWNKQNTVLDPGKSTPATITLTVDSYTGSLTSFSFNIVITGAE